MDTMQAFIRGEANRGKEMKVFDWEMAAKIIKERKAQTATAGLDEDWAWTAGEILEDGQPLDKEHTYVYLASTWATPSLEIGDERIPCFRMESETPKWDQDTYWPPEARLVLSA